LSIFILLMAYIEAILLFIFISIALCKEIENINYMNNLKGAENETSFGVKCFLVQKWNVYDLKGLSRHIKAT